MADAWTAKNRLLALGVPLEFALYVLPNAKALRFVESGSLHRAAAQVDAAHLLQRAGGDLPGVDGRDRAGAGRAPAARPAPRPAVRRAQRARLAALHRGHALLRRAGVEQLPERASAASDVAPCLPWLAHLYTALGAVLALSRRGRGDSRGDFRAAFLWPGRRHLRRRHRRRAGAARCGSRSGCRGSTARSLDDIVDYLTYVFVPVLLIVWRAGLRARRAGRSRSAAPCCSPAPTASAAPTPRWTRPTTSSPASRRTGTSSSLYLYVWRLPPIVNAAILLALAVLVFVPIRYVYPSRTRDAARCRRWCSACLGRAGPRDRLAPAGHGWSVDGAVAGLSGLLLRAVALAAPSAPLHPSTSHPAPSYVAARHHLPHRLHRPAGLRHHHSAAAVLRGVVRRQRVHDRPARHQSSR